MNIVRLIGKFSEKGEGGLSPNCYHVSKEQIKQGHDVTIFALTSGENRSIELDGINVHWVKRPRRARVFAGPKLFNEIKRKNLKPDVVHSLAPMQFGWLFPLAKKKIEAKYAFSVHGSTRLLEKIGFQGFRSWWDSFEYGKLCRFLAKRVDIVLPVAEFIKKELVEDGIYGDKIKVIPSGVDFAQFNKKTGAKKAGKFTVLYVGRFAQKKGLGRLIKAANLLKGKNVRFVLVGGSRQDNDYAKVINLIKKFNLEKTVEIRPSVPPSALPAIYQSVDVFVLPSIMEARPKVVFEAMAAGCPVIATAQGGTLETIRDSFNGLLVQPGNEQAIAKAIERLMDDSALRKRLVENGLKTAQEVDWKKIAAQYTKAFELIE